MSNILQFPEKRPSGQEQPPHKTGEGLNTPPDTDETSAELQRRRQALIVESSELNSDITKDLAEIYSNPKLTNEEVLNRIDEKLREYETTRESTSSGKLGALAIEHTTAGDPPLAPVVNLFDRR